MKVRRFTANGSFCGVEKNNSSIAKRFIRFLATSLLLFSFSLPAWAVNGTDGNGASSSNVTQGDTNGNIASGANSYAGNGGFGVVGGNNNAAFDGGSAGNGGNGGNYNMAFGENSQAGNANGSTPGTNDNIAIGSDPNQTTLANGGNSIAIGTGAQSTGNNSVALGAGSTDGGQSNVVSVGNATTGLTRTIINVANGNIAPGSTDAVNGGQLYNVQTTASNAMNLANSAQNTANSALAMGQQNTQQIQQNTTTIAQNTVQIKAIVNGQLGVCTVNNGALSCSVIGQTPASAKGQGAVAIGAGANANGAGAMAYGQNASAKYAGSVAIGAGAQANADPTTAVGNNAVANGNNSVALGANATANGDNSVALGQGSVANRPNSVSVGDAATGLTRQITNVAPGTAPTDAVNLGQLNQAVANVLGQAKTYADKAAAAAMAIPQTPVLAPGKKWIGFATGAYDNQMAVGVGFAYQVDRHWNIGGGLSTAVNSSPSVAVRVQTGFEW